MCCESLTDSNILHGNKIFWASNDEDVETRMSNKAKALRVGGVKRDMVYIKKKQGHGG